MKVKIRQFCSLATSPSWQAWLFHYNNDIYTKFIKSLRESHGCTDTRELMQELLIEIQNGGGGVELFEFLSKHYPYMIESDNNENIEDGYDDIFVHYNPKILTYPRRLILTGEKRELLKRIKEFLLDKIKSDYIIIRNKAYIEYLEKCDAALVDEIPIENWMISKYRQK